MAVTVNLAAEDGLTTPPGSILALTRCRGANRLMDIEPADSWQEAICRDGAEDRTEPRSQSTCCTDSTHEHYAFSDAQCRTSAGKCHRFIRHLQLRHTECEELVEQG